MAEIYGIVIYFFLPFLPLVMVLIYLRCCYVYVSGYTLKKYTNQVGMGIFLLITSGVLYGVRMFLFNPIYFGGPFMDIVNIEALIILVVGLLFLTFGIKTYYRESIRCPSCNKKFRTEWELSQHDRVEHENP